MIRQRTTPLFLTLALLAAAVLQTACAESNGNEDDAQQQAASQEQSTSSGDEQAAQEKQNEEQQAAANTQVAANDSDAGGDQAADSNDNGDGSSDKPYEVSCGEETCKANQEVVTGYEKYHAHCHTCHGPNGSGSSFAPSLVKRLKKMEQGEFTSIVANGRKRFDSTTGTYSVMPGWKDNPDVMSNVGQLWAYLKARADGALPGVHPEPMD